MAKKSNPIPNAEGVIEAFGGIRPMAKKMDVAVTTVQGWKKRDAIPAARLDQVLAAAQAHDIDLEGVLEGSVVANENISHVNAVADAVESVMSHDNEGGEEFETDEFDVTEKSAAVDGIVDEDGAEAETPIELMHSVSSDEAPMSVPSASRAGQSAEDVAALKAKIALMEQKSAKKATFVTLAISFVLFVVFTGFAYLLLAPTPQQGQEDLERLRALEDEVNAVQSDVDGVKKEQGILGGLVPKDLDSQLAKLKQQAQNVQAQAQEKIGQVTQDVSGQVTGQVLQQAQALKNNVVSGDIGGNVQQGLQSLGTGIQGATSNVVTSASPVLSGFSSKIQGLQGNVDGQIQLEDGFSAIQEVIAGLGTQGTASLPAGLGEFNAALDGARSENPVLGQLLADVPQDELKAAALLLGMSQFRSTLNRDSEAFDGDLNALTTLVGSDNPELTSALERLAPHAQSGVLSFGGLSDEFKTLAGEAVVASIKGEDVSIQERAQARFNDLFQVEKGGELVSGTPTQAALAKTQNLLEGGDLAGAISSAQELQAIDGDAAAVLAPWLGKAQGTLSAQEVQGLLTKSISGSMNAGAFGAP